MRVVVQKYGGSSVADLGRLRLVAERIAGTRATGAAVVVVVSAMGNTTNELLALARQVSPHPDRRELDMLLSVGERISMALVAMALCDLGVPACSLTGSQSGIITNESHSDARVVEVRAERVRRHLEQGQVVIVAGFQGVSRAREVTTLGRGGSDTTAVVLAAALQAEYCEICSDVDGVWSADPRVVPQAIQLGAMSLDVALELARGGAKVLYEEAVRYARDQSVAIRASSTFGPGAGTLLARGASPEPAAVAVTSDDQLVVVRLGSEGVEEAAVALRQAGARVRRRVGDLLHVEIRNAHGGIPALPGGAVVVGPTAVVSAAGSSLGENLEDIARADAALRAAGVQVFRRGAQGDGAWWEVAPGDLDVAARALHAVLVQ
jgi:aspartate kinase